MSKAKQEDLTNFVNWLESFNREAAAIDVLKKMYAADVHFTDPLNDVHGIPATHKAFDKIFDDCDDLRIKVTASAIDGPTALLTWDMSFKYRGTDQIIEGASRVSFNDDGLISEHRDFWDAVPVFETVPVLGGALKWMKNRMFTTD